MSRLNAYEKLKQRLMRGDLEPGQFITQREFAELAGVSVGAAREAIMHLEHERLLRVYPQSEAAAAAKERLARLK